MTGTSKHVIELGKGTTFKIYLPLYRGVSEEVRKEADHVPLTGGSETILVAEDDAALRKLTETVLRNYGYSVISAVDGIDAVTKYGENRDIVKLIILDGIMPGMNGKEVYQEIRILTPTIKTIIASGYARGRFWQGKPFCVQIAFYTSNLFLHRLC